MDMEETPSFDFSYYSLPIHDQMAKRILQVNHETYKVASLLGNGIGVASLGFTQVH